MKMLLDGPAPSYAVVWREASGPVCAGKLELGESALTLQGSGPCSSLEQSSIVYDDLTGVRVGRAPADRINGRQSVILDRGAAPPISIGAISGLGIVSELAQVLAELLSEQVRNASRVVVVVPIKRGAAERARALIRSGPPFDLEQVPLDRHHVFVTDREVVFLFEGWNVRRAVERLVRSPGVWKAAAAWKDCLAGRPRLAEEGFSWVRPGGTEANSPWTSRGRDAAATGPSSARLSRRTSAVARDG